MDNSTVFLIIGILVLQFIMNGIYAMIISRACNSIIYHCNENHAVEMKIRDDQAKFSYELLMQIHEVHKLVDKKKKKDKKKPLDN